MKPKLVVVAIIVLALLGGIGYMIMSKRAGNPPVSPPTGGNVFTSIKDALSKSLSLECSFTDAEGRQTKAYVKSGAVRSDFTGKTANESGSVIVKDKKMYFWNSQGGFMMEIPEETPVAGQKAPETPGSVGDVMGTLEKYKENCKPSVVSDSLFTPPTNITFQDFSKMMQQITPPTGASPQAMPSIDYTKYLQQNPSQAPQE